jgi:hypothetical protein
MPSYSPEAIERAKRPTFNNTAASVWSGGIATPPGVKAVDIKTQIALSPGPVLTLAITNAGTGLANGTPTGVATTAVTGTGTGLTVNLTVAGGIVTVATINAAGSGYVTGNTVNVTGYAGVVLTVTI